MNTPVIYFLCTGNSCRSQMAEGWARHYGENRIEVHSAGIEPCGLNPQAVKAMGEAGVDIAHHTSKPIDPNVLSRTDYVITLCGDAEESCPVTPGNVKRLHWGLPDPARVRGTEQAIAEAFREVCDDIRKRVRDFLTGELNLEIAD